MINGIVERTDHFALPIEPLSLGANNTATEKSLWTWSHAGALSRLMMAWHRKLGNLFMAPTIDHFGSYPTDSGNM
jgi:hypothetical protein